MNIEFRDYMKNVKNIMTDKSELLIEMDQVFGDGDLGLTMSDGFEAAYESIKNIEENDIGKLSYIAGKNMARAVPSTMGTLMASGLMEAGKVLRNQTQMDIINWISFFEAYANGVMKRGKANEGDKTFLDGLLPAVRILKKTKDINLAYVAAVEGYNSTEAMRAVHGRAAIRGEASRNFKDPGAYVAVLLFKALKCSQGSE